MQNANRNKLITCKYVHPNIRPHKLICKFGDECFNKEFTHTGFYFIVINLFIISRWPFT